MGQGNQRRGRSRAIWHEREIPAKSNAWLVAGRTLLSVDVGVAVAAATTPEKIGIRPETLWVSTGALAVLAVVCFSSAPGLPAHSRGQRSSSKRQRTTTRDRTFKSAALGEARSGSAFRG